MDQRLKILRKNIDNIDEKILDLLEDRMKIVQGVGELKQELDISVEDLNREGEIIERLNQHSSGKLSEKQLIRIFTSVFKSSKQVQQSGK